MGAPGIAARARARGRAAAALLAPAALGLVLALLCTPAPARAQEKKVSLLFTGDLLSMIATDNQGEQTAEIVDRLIGLSPSLLGARLQRASGRVALTLTTSADEETPVTFLLSVDKMVYYRMRTARADVTGMTEALQEAKAVEPLLTAVAYRFDGRYSIIDCTIDLRPAVKAAREMQARREAEERAAAEAKAAADAKAAAEARAVADQKAAAEAKAAAARAAAEAKAAAEAAAAAEARAAAEAKAAKPPPAPSSPSKEPSKEPAKEVPPPPAAREVTYLAAKALGRESAPGVDGQAGDGAWQLAQPFSFEVQGASGRLTVTASALWTPDRVWLLLRWPDKTRDDVHRPWVWSKDEKAYVAGREIEDALAVSLSREGRMGECMLAGNEAETDLWTWRAARTDPSGFAEDATMTLSFQRIARANSYQTRNGRTVWVKEEPDAGSRPYQSQVAGAYAGDRIPRYVSRTPSGSMADVAARGSWKDGFWTVELSRRLATGDPADAALAPGRDAYFSVAVFNSREGVDHSTSKELVLRLE